MKKEARNAEIVAERMSGASVEELSKAYGVSRARIYQILKSRYRPRKCSKVFFAPAQCAYPCIARWMNENRCDTSDLARAMGVCYDSVYAAITGRTDFKKRMIDKLLDYTGMDYKEAFWVDDHI